MLGSKRFKHFQKKKKRPQTTSVIALLAGIIKEIIVLSFRNLLLATMKVSASKPMMLLGEGVIRVEVEGVLDQATHVVRLHSVGAERASEPHLAAGRGPFRESQGLLGMSLWQWRRGSPTAGAIATKTLRWRRWNRQGHRVDARAMPLRRRRGIPTVPNGRR